MLKKIFLILFLTIISTNAFTDSIKDYVCVVKGNLSVENQNFLNQYKDELAKSGFGRYSDYIESFLKGTFGSGFIYYSSNGTPFILTNKHVVSEYETANIYFENEDGSTSEFKDLTILATDENIDIALIALPKKFNKKGLELTTTTLNDGDEVWSAGFPGLGGKPMWQLGNGIVSNSKVKLKELLDPAISTLIQHTAEIDGGNSGGPLLVKNSKTTSGYSVVGINTWKAYYRQNTNYAIPSKILEEFVKNNISGKATIDIDSRINSFVKTLDDNEKFYELTRFISNKMVSEYGQTFFKKILATAPESIRSAAVETFAYNPLEGMRYSIAYCLWNEFRTEEGFQMPEVGTPTENAGVYTLKFNPKTKAVVSCQWIKENGQWKLSDFDSNKNSKSKSRKNKISKVYFDIEPVGSFELSGSYVSSLSLNKSGFDIQGVGILNCLKAGVFLQNQKVSYIYENKNKQENVLITGIIAELQLPVLINSFIVEPFAYARIGFVNFYKLSDSDFSTITAGVGGGINIGYETPSNFAPFITLKYNYLPFYLTGLTGTLKDNKISNHEIAIGLGFKI